MQSGIYFNVAKLNTQKNGKPHGLPFRSETWGSPAPKFNLCLVHASHDWNILQHKNRLNMFNEKTILQK